MLGKNVALLPRLVLVELAAQINMKYNAKCKAGLY